jgi:hypothetical protein
MSIPQRVSDALHWHRIPEASATAYGYRVEDGQDNTARIRWGCGEPFRALPDLPAMRRGQGRASCARALVDDGFHVVPREFGDSDGLFLLVAERLPQA